MTGLKDVSWKSSAYGDGNIPTALLEALRSDPKVRLHAKVDTQSIPARHGFTGPESNFYKLQNNTNLSKLEAEIVYEDDTDCLEATKPLKRILLSCPNIRSLSLDISLPQSGCMVYGPPDKYCGFGFVENEKLPPLEELVISAYPWGHEPSGVLDPVFGGQMIGYPGKGSEMNYWTENFDWSRLRRLKTAYVDFSLKIMPNLTALKEVGFSGSGSDDDVVRFYQQCPTALEVIGAESLQSITLDGVLRHGKALRKLQLHTVEDWGGEWAKQAPDLASLRSIRDGCPLIEDLFVDIARDRDWPWEILDTLASFPRLRHLTICFELGVRCGDNPVKPYITFTAANTIYKYFLSLSPRQPSILSQLHSYSGAPPPLGYGYPSPHAFWPQSNSTESTCKLSERDDDAARGVFEVECPKPPKDNPRSADTSLLGDGKNTAELTREAAARKIAHEGPTRMSEWEWHY